MPFKCPRSRCEEANDPPKWRYRTKIRLKRPALSLLTGVREVSPGARVRRRRRRARSGVPGDQDGEAPERDGPGLGVADGRAGVRRGGRLLGLLPHRPFRGGRPPQCRAAAQPLFFVRSRRHQQFGILAGGDQCRRLRHRHHGLQHHRATYRRSLHRRRAASSCTIAPTYWSPPTTWWRAWSASGCRRPCSRSIVPAISVVLALSLTTGGIV